MTPKSNTSSRTYSKRLTAWCLGGFYVIAAYGIAVASPVAAEILTILGSTSLAHLLLYMGVGHLDLKSMIATGLLDLRKKGPPNV